MEGPRDRDATYPHDFLSRIFFLVASQNCKPKQDPNGCREERRTRKKREVGKRLDRENHMEEEDGSGSEDEDSGKEVENQPITALGCFLVY
ncbi:hypothetical protein L1887_13600 [Cichorium endivia]|nr:hypothetical protein L1887_13600 [Cichorium endivia]